MKIGISFDPYGRTYGRYDERKFLKIKQHGYDAVDYSHYKATGKLRIVKEKFVENFIRRFSENATLNKTYKVNFYSITESPPSASVEIIAKTGDFKVDFTPVGPNAEYEKLK